MRRRWRVGSEKGEGGEVLRNFLTRTLWPQAVCVVTPWNLFPRFHIIMASLTSDELVFPVLPLHSWATEPRRYCNPPRLCSSSCVCPPPFPRPFIGKLLSGRTHSSVGRRAIRDSFVGLPHSPCFISNAALVQLCSLNSPDIPKIAHLFVQFADVAQFLIEYVRR